ncbi:hypothetical protein MN608_10114 [Microdochium nivale]|nr:hypothetical protein MN608_10114 [Microdochium nivale]
MDWTPPAHSRARGGCLEVPRLQSVADNCRHSCLNNALLPLCFLQSHWTFLPPITLARLLPEAASTYAGGPPPPRFCQPANDGAATQLGAAPHSSLLSPC